MTARAEARARLLWVALFAAAFAFVEAAVVTYLRELYYPEGFRFPLVVIPGNVLIVELIREAATLVMLGAVAMIAGASHWRRFGYFLVSFGVWDVFFYLWLKAILGWPSSLLEWDILFLLPLPWIGPVIAPASIALLMTAGGSMIVCRTSEDPPLRPGAASWLLAVAATCAALYSFMHDTGATLRGEIPEPYQYWLLVLSLIMYVVSMALAWRRAGRGRDRPAET